MRNRMDINVDLLQWSINFLIKKSILFAGKSACGTDIKNENISSKESAKEFNTNQLLENSRKEKYTHVL